jgi:hypothetical protein
MGDNGANILDEEGKTPSRVVQYLARKPDGFYISEALKMSATTSVVKWSDFLAAERRCIVLPVRYELNLYMLCRRK